jgi:hypothetical protein
MGPTRLRAWGRHQLAHLPLEGSYPVGCNVGVSWWDPRGFGPVGDTRLTYGFLVA